MTEKQVVVLGQIAQMASMGLPPDRFEALAAEVGGVVEVKWVDPGQSPEDIVRESRDAIAIIPAGGNRALTTEHVRELPNLRLILKTNLLNLLMKSWIRFMVCRNILMQRVRRICLG